MARKKFSSEELVQKRRRHVLELKLAGHTINAIVQILELKGYGSFVPRTIKRDLAVQFKRDFQLEYSDEPALNETEMRIHFGHMEEVISQMFIKISDKTTQWKSFEKEKAIQVYFDMAMKFAQLKGWVNKNSAKSAFGKPYSLEFLPEEETLPRPDYITNFVKAIDDALEKAAKN